MVSVGMAKEHRSHVLPRYGAYGAGLAVLRQQVDVVLVQLQTVAGAQELQIVQELEQHGVGAS